MLLVVACLDVVIAHLFVFVVIVLLFMAILSGLLCFCIGVYRFDGAACMCVTFIYRRAKATTEFEVTTAFTRETAPPRRPPPVFVTHYDQ